MNEELPRSKGDALLERLMQLRMLYEKEHEVYDAAMALTETDIELILDVLANCEELEALERFEALRDSCRRAKEGR